MDRLADSDDLQGTEVEFPAEDLGESHARQVSAERFTVGKVPEGFGDICIHRRLAMEHEAPERTPQVEHREAQSLLPHAMTQLEYSPVAGHGH